jgi:hypothetical protein
MADRNQGRNQDQIQDEIIELTDVVEDTVQSREKTGDAPFWGDEDSRDSGGDEGKEPLSDDDLDFDALFEELDADSQSPVANADTDSVESPLAPEDEGEVTGGIHAPDSEEDFDALLEDLDKSEDMLSSLDEPVEDTPEEEQEEDEDGVLSPVDELEDEKTVETETVGKLPGEEAEEPELDKTDPAEAEVGEADIGEAEIEEAEIEEAELEEAEVEEADDTEPESEPEPLEQDKGIDIRDLANRLERLENAGTGTQVSEERLLSALNELPSDSSFWDRIEERIQRAVENRVLERTEDMEKRITHLQQKLDSLASGNLVTRQTLVQEIRDVKKELPSMEELEEQKQQLRQELTQELESQIPAAAARVIREEIRNLSSEMEE